MKEILAEEEASQRRAKTQQPMAPEGPTITTTEAPERWYKVVELTAKDKAPPHPKEMRRIEALNLEAASTENKPYLKQ